MAYQRYSTFSEETFREDPQGKIDAVETTDFRQFTFKNLSELLSCPFIKKLSNSSENVSDCANN